MSDLNEAVRIAYEQGRQDALEEVRAEIRQIVDEETEHDGKWARGLHYSLCIIDKYKGDKE